MSTVFSPEEVRHWSAPLTASGMQLCS